MEIVPRVACKLTCQLGEGPVWIAQEQAIWFVDIKGGTVNRFSPSTGNCEKHETGGQPSFVLPLAEGGMIVGSGNRLYRFEGDRLGDPILTLEMPNHNRTNDATVDRAGRLWFGTMDDEERRPTGAVHSLERGVLTTTAWRAVVTNGPAVTTDGSFLYHVDSAEQTVWRIPVRNGICAERGEVFLQLTEGEGYPDGVVLDSEECLWVALWDGWGVRRYSPDGKLLLHVPLPCARATKVAFGGPYLRTAYVTTARTGLSGYELAEQPMAGSLFAFAAPAAGLPVTPVRLT